LCCLFGCGLIAAPLPKIAREGNKYSLLFEGKPYLILGAQVNNSSGWPSQFEKLLPGAAALHLNTIEVPVYWEDVEPQEGQFRFDTFDRILQLAREHQFRPVLLWFGTLKNGTMDYAPGWVKANPDRFPRMLDEGGHPVRVLTPLSETNLQADQRAYSQLIRHLKLIDGEQHTVILVQVENEPGSLFTDRDHSHAANRKFADQVPAPVLKALHIKPGTWKEAFGAAADEALAAYYVSRYVKAAPPRAN
jgi:beta-galactosidase GanA